jgi:metal-sulfur cluster biosynthetic enzyme
MLWITSTKRGITEASVTSTSRLRSSARACRRMWAARSGRADTIVKEEIVSTKGAMVVTEERVQDQLRNVIDPEIGMDLVELGLIYDVGVHEEGRHVDVTFSLTSPMCPVGDLIQEQVETEALSIEGVETVNAQLTFDPMWSPEMMSPAAKLFFGR